MRAWFATRYGGPEVLELRTVPMPRVKQNEMLVRVQATAVSSGDRRLRQLDFPYGLHLIGRLIFGFTRLRRPVLGCECSGTVVQTGSEVSRFVPGDEVIVFRGMKMGTHAEYLVVADDAIVLPRPQGLRPTMAAAIAFGGTTACDFLRRANLQPGEEVLVIGSTGAVGSALVQLAVAAGARVTAVASTANQDLARQLGAHHVLDYTSDGFALKGNYDIIADTAGKLGFKPALPNLKDGGRYLAINGGVGEMLTRKAGSRRCISGPAGERREDLVALLKLISEGKYQPLVGEVIPFEQLPQAHQIADSGHKRGSVVVLMNG